MTDICSDCGKDLKEGAIKCIHCGSYLNETQLKNESNSAKEWGMGAFGIGFFLGIVIFYFNYYFGNGAGGFPIFNGFLVGVIFFIPVYLLVSIKNWLIEKPNSIK
jgi:hypothetical protein